MIVVFARDTFVNRAFRRCPPKRYRTVDYQVRPQNHPERGVKHEALIGKLAWQLSNSTMISCVL